jgi:uncharacterized protein
VAAAFNHPFLTKIYNWFSEQIVKLTALGVQEGMALEAARPEPDRHSKIRDLLQFADLGIRDYRIRKTSIVGNESEPDVEYSKTSGHNLDFEFLHGKDEEAHLVFLAEEESAGTNRFYAILAQRIEVLSKGQSVLVDKLDQSLHPLLMRAMGACSITRQ